MHSSRSAGGGEIVEAPPSPPAAPMARGGQERGGPATSTKQLSVARNNTATRFDQSSASAPPHSDTSSDDGDILEITLDVIDDVAVAHCVHLPRGGGATAEEKKKRRYSLWSSRMRYVSRELRRLSSQGRGGDARRGRSGSAAAHALDGLRFITGGGGAAGWAYVEARFDKLTKDQGGVLKRSQFGQCIGMEEMKEKKKEDSRKKEDKDKKETGRRQDGRTFGWWWFGMRQEVRSEKPADGKEAEKPKEPDFAGELFDALLRRRNMTGDTIDKDELLEFWDQISDTSFEGRLQTFFDMVDKDCDGRITEEEVKEIITLSASANKLSKVQERSEEYARLIMEELDPGNLGYIELYNLEMFLLQAPSQPDTYDEDHVRLSQMLSMSMRRRPESNPLRRWYRRARYFLEDNWRRVWVMLLWLSVCVGLFTWKFVQYRRRYVFHVMGYCVCVAKGGAETLKFNMALILLPVCRNTITWIRNRTAAGRVVPFDDNLNFHKVVAVGITVGAALHIISHLTCDFPRLLHATDAEYAPLAQYFATSKDWRPPNYWWFVRGTEGWTGLVMLVLMAAAFTLATPRFRRANQLELRPALLKKMTGFNAFWYSHHCFVVVYALLIVHGHYLYLTHKWYKKSTWMYLAVPMAVYAGERLTRALRSSVRKVEIVKVVEYPGKVLSLHFSTKPHEFQYRSGQYIFVKCNAVSPFQWHPFSITSDPHDDYVSVHIRVQGDWTGELKETFSPTPKDKKDQVRDEARVVYDCNDPMTNQRKLPEVLIDGPYGAPAQDYRQYDIVLLIGNGIGGTPMVSIIKDIVNNVKQQRQHDGDLEAGSGAGNSVSASSPFRTRRAYFYWTTREQGTLGWFRGAMDEVAGADMDGVIELHCHCTSVHREDDARSAFIAMVQSLNHAKHGVDVVSGSRVKAHFGRPNWHSVYKRIAVKHREQCVGVFYCGAAGLMKELRELAREFSQKTNTKFEFHKENF